ncbi:GGDEF domain-containing protein [Pseudomonas poae]|nr:GGDEF domain-containing protein [Pseudomonas poae]
MSEPLVMMNGQTVIFFVAPVFDDELKKTGDDGLRGFALATMQVSFLMEQNIPVSSLEYLNVVLTVNDADQHEKEVYRSREPAVGSQLYAQHKLTFADRSYTLKLSATRNFLRLNDNHLNLYRVAAAGGCLTLLLTLVIYLLISQRARAVSLVEERTGELVRLSTTDYLTDVYNRRYFEQSMARLLIESRDGALALCVVMFDIDHFKRINDCFGHLQGDRVLRQLSQMIRSTTRSSDILCRTGGEEFILICPNTTLGAAGQMAEKLRQTIGAGSFADVGHVTCSFGVVEWQTWESLDHLLSELMMRSMRPRPTGETEWLFTRA